MKRNRFGTGEAHPLWKGGRYISMGYVMVLQPDHPRACKGYVQEHLLIAEKAVGHYLSRKTPIHHFNEIKTDNSGGNLVVCEDRGYHSLLHARQRALDASGNPDFRCCVFCGAWTSPDNMVVRNRGHRHKMCETIYARNQRQKRMQS